MPLFKVTVTPKNLSRSPQCYIVDIKDEGEARDVVGITPEDAYKVEPYVPTPSGTFFVVDSRPTPARILQVEGKVKKRLLDARWYKLYQECFTYHAPSGLPRQVIVGENAFRTEAGAKDLVLRITQAKLVAVKAAKAKLNQQEAHLLAFVRELVG